MELQVQNSVRPWQGTVLGVLNIISLVMAGMLFLFISFGSSFVAQFTQDPMVTAIMGFGVMVAVIFTIPFLVLAVFVTIGVFKGQKWTIIVMLIFSVIGILGTLSEMFSGTVDVPYISLAINGFVLYCEIIALKSPFYK
jgi:hypothetical protein